MNKYFKQTRYSVQAKRKNTDKKWSEWTNVNSYRAAEKHACRVEEVGYDAKIVVKDKAVEELWAILGNSYQAAEQTDAILDAGFRKEIEVTKAIFEGFETLFGKATKVSPIPEIINTKEYKYFKNKYLEVKDD